MHYNKINMIKNYSKIIKEKKRNGEIQNVGQELKEQKIQMSHQEMEEQSGKKKVEELGIQEFEDPVEDVYQEQEEWVSQQEEERSQDEEERNDSGTMISEKKQSKMQEREEEQPQKAIFMGNNKNLAKGQVLEFDNRAYDMLHRLNVQWPSMSIDFITKNSPFDSSPQPAQQMTNYPYQIFTVQGSCNNTLKNSIYLTKWSNLCQTKYDDDPELGEEQDPQITVQQIQTTSDVNRIRSLNYSPIVAFWNDNGNNGQIRIVDLSSNYQKLCNGISSKRRQKAKEIVVPFQCAGYGLAWNPHKIGQLVVGDNYGRVTVLANNANYTSWSKTSIYNYHQGSVQDIVFSPQQSYVFASCSSDGTLQIVDMRVNNHKKAQMKIKAHTRDVNVCDWNKVATHLIVTGSDDACVKVWDLRLINEGAQQQVLNFNWHTQPITSIKFQPNDESVIAVSSEDNRLSLWDMSMQNQQGDPDVPNQLMFLHQGQEQIKEVLFHPIYNQMIISTSLDAINIFKPSLEMPQIDLDQKDDKQDLKRPPIYQQDLDKYIQRMSLQ